MSEVIWAAMIAAGSGLVGVAIGSWLTPDRPPRNGHKND